MQLVIKVALLKFCGTSMLEKYHQHNSLHEKGGIKQSIGKEAVLLFPDTGR